MGHYRTGVRQAVTVSSVPPVLTLVYDPGTGLATWTWSGPNPDFWALILYPDTDLNDDAIMTVTGDQRTMTVSPGLDPVWLLATDDANDPLFPRSNPSP